MTEFPSDATVDVLRSIITLCKNEKVTHIKCGPIEISFDPYEDRPQMSEADKRKFEEMVRRREYEDRFAASGFVPNRLTK